MRVACILLMPAAKDELDGEGGGGRRGGGGKLGVLVILVWIKSQIALRD